ncbi:MAG: hypothetical protein JO103_12320 [Candidatus Eremiobacteraeota bacterium]|nr:hypothetical protein [Candidatus Eremiobacteraeota bacterium]MBV9408544.1 hypothetical protein [Candidatus Eremiobacteraeota bacterium]
MIAQADPSDVFGWALNHARDIWWLIAVVIGLIAWTNKRLGAFRRASARATGAQGPTASAQRTMEEAVRRALAGDGQPAQAAPQPAATAQAAPKPPQPARPVQSPRSAVVVAEPVTPTIPVRQTLAEAFGDPAHARTAVILAEVLAPPLAMR